MSVKEKWDEDLARLLDRDPEGWFGASSVQRMFRWDYGRALDALVYGSSKGVLEEDNVSPWRYRIKR